MGNFNIDLMNLVSANQNRLDSNTLRFLECPLSHGLYAVCLVPSRITDTSYSLIDNIFSPESAVSTYVIPDDSSDHCLLMADFSLYFPYNEKKSTKRRDFGEIFCSKLKEALGDVGWSSVIDEMDPDQSLDNFYNILTEKLDKFCPYRNLKGKRQTPRKPWVNASLLRSINEKKSFI